MTTTRELALNLATHLATDNWVPEGIAIPKVFMDAITQDVDIGDHPAVIVIPRIESAFPNNNPQHTVEVVLAINSTAFVSNAAAHAETPEGVIIYGSGRILDSVLVNLVNTIRDALPGAMLDEVQIEFALDSLPIQYATITLTYGEISVFGD